MRWRITIVIYPHSTGNGQEADRKAAGTDGGDHYFYVDAEDFKEAVKMASCYVAALQSHLSLLWSFVIFPAVPAVMLAVLNEPALPLDIGIDAAFIIPTTCSPSQTTCSLLATIIASYRENRLA